MSCPFPTHAFATLQETIRMVKTSTLSQRTTTRSLLCNCHTAISTNIVPPHSFAHGHHRHHHHPRHPHHRLSWPHANMHHHADCATPLRRRCLKWSSSAPAPFPTPYKAAEQLAFGKEADGKEGGKEAGGKEEGKEEKAADEAAEDLSCDIATPPSSAPPPSAAPQTHFMKHGRHHHHHDHEYLRRDCCGTMPRSTNMRIVHAPLGGSIGHCSGGGSPPQQPGTQPSQQGTQPSQQGTQPSHSQVSEPHAMDPCHHDHQTQHHSSFHATLPLPALSQAATPWSIPTTTIAINITIADNPCHGTLPPQVGVAEDPSDTSRAAVLLFRGRVIAVCVASDCVVVSSLSCHGVHGCTCIHTSANRFWNDFQDLFWPAT